MFIISQYILKTTKLLPSNLDIATYSVIIGLVLYAVIYLYLYFFNTSMLSFLNNIIIYIIGVDLLLSTFYYYNLQKEDNKKYINANNISYNEVNLNDTDTILSDEESDEESEEETNYEQSEDVSEDVSENENQQTEPLTNIKIDIQPQLEIPQQSPAVEVQQPTLEVQQPTLEVEPPSLEVQHTDVEQPEIKPELHSTETNETKINNIMTDDITVNKSINITDSTDIIEKQKLRTKRGPYKKKEKSNLL
jgi:cytoskeletal protein RodZ